MNNADRPPDHLWVECHDCAGEGLESYATESVCETCDGEGGWYKKQESSNE